MTRAAALTNTFADIHVCARGADDLEEAGQLSALGEGNRSVPDPIDGPDAARRDRTEVEVHAVAKAKLGRRASASEHFEVASMLANIFGPMN